MAKSVHQPAVQFDGRRLVSEHGVHTPKRIILHDTEGHDAAGIKDLSGVCQFWHDQKLGYGAHVIVDADGNSARAVSDHYIAWHVEHRNTGSLGIEIIGYAKWPRTAWIRRLKQLHKVARWLAFWSKRWNIPLYWDVEHGVSTHKAQSKHFGGSHVDPGDGFPVGFVLQLARTYKKLGW